MASLSILALCLAAFVAAASSHEFCSFDSENLGVAIDEASCKELCRTHDSASPHTHRCFAYRYFMASERCTGYVFDYEDAYYYEDETVECEANYGVQLVEPVGDGTEPAPDRIYVGCDFDREPLGFAGDSGQCRDLCTGLVSNVWGGCAAWFFDPDGECIGLLADFDVYDDTPCGVMEA